MELSNRSQKKFDSILKNAEKEFIQYGYNRVTMDSISKKANVSKVTLYKYFSDKQVLYEHILRKNYLKEFNVIESIINSDMLFKDKIENIIKTRLDKYYDVNQLIVENDYFASLDMDNFIKERTLIMNSLNKILYTEGKNEGLIREDLSTITITKYFDIIRTGLISNFRSLQELDNDDLSKLLEVLYAGVLGCKFSSKVKED